MEQKQLVAIKPEMYVAEILADHPEKARLISEVLTEFGINCAGCGAAAYETLEQGVLGHGFSKSDLDKLVVNLNKVVSGHIAPKIAHKPVIEFSFTITPRAASKIKAIMESEDKKGYTLHIRVLAGGCSGYSYDLEFVKKPSASTFKITQDGLSVEVDQESLDLLKGTTLDFVDTLKESGFKFSNPNVSKECGCGKSFS